MYLASLLDLAFLPGLLSESEELSSELSSASSELLLLLLLSESLEVIEAVTDRLDCILFLDTFCALLTLELFFSLPFLLTLTVKSLLLLCVMGERDLFDP